MRNSVIESDDEVELQIEEYNSQRDGEAVGILWADGLIEMLPPLFVETVLHPKVMSVLVALEGFLLPLSPRLLDSPSPYSSWILPAVPPAILLLISLSTFLLMATMRIHLRWSKNTRIENAFTSSDSKESSTKEIIGQWVVRSRQSAPGNQESADAALGCVSLYSEEDENGRKQVYLSHLTISPCLRRQGWGNKLAAIAEAKARAINASSIRILVGNVKSKPFWLQRGYKRLYPRWTLLGHESLYMELDLQEKRSKDLQEKGPRKAETVYVHGNPQYKGNVVWVSTRSQAMFLN